MRNEIIYDLAESEYHDLRAPSYVSGSALKPMISGIAAECLVPFKGTKQTRFGTLFHTRMLQPELFGDGKSHHVIPDKYPDEKGKLKDWHGGANYCKQWLAEHTDRLNIQATGDLSLETIEAMRTSLLSFPEAAGLLAMEGHSEVSMFAPCPLTSMQLKCRSDRLAKDLDGKVFIADIKTSSDPMRFEWEGHHHIQSEMNTRIARLNGIEVAEFCYIVVGTCAPYAVRLLALDDESKAKAAEEVTRLLHRFRDHAAANYWPAFRVGPDLAPVGIERRKFRIWEDR